MAKLAFVVLALFVAGAYAQQALDGAVLQIQFDNRGSKVEGAKDKLVTSVAKMLGVPAKNVEMKVTGQSSLLNHQSVATFTAIGPAANGKPVLNNCNAAVKSGWFSKSAAAKNLNKASDSWMPGDSVKVEKATCGALPKVLGRKM